MAGSSPSMTWMGLSPAPNFLGQFHDHAELRPLLVLGEDIAFLGRCEAALRRETKLVDVDEFRGFVDPPFERILAFELAALGGDEPEHHRLALRHGAQRLEAPGPRGVV